MVDSRTSASGCAPSLLYWLGLLGDFIRHLFGQTQRSQPLRLGAFGSRSALYWDIASEASAARSCNCAFLAAARRAASVFQTSRRVLLSPSSPGLSSPAISVTGAAMRRCRAGRVPMNALASRKPSSLATKSST
jgi:hypothetical protein